MTWSGHKTRGWQALKAIAGTPRPSKHNSAVFLLTLMTGTRKMEYKGSSWHETCFICHRCQQPIGTKSFIPKDNQNFCVPCYEKQHAMQCVQCKKVFQIPPWPLHILAGLPPWSMSVSSLSKNKDTRDTGMAWELCLSCLTCRALSIGSGRPSFFQKHQRC